MINIGTYTSATQANSGNNPGTLIATDTSYSAGIMYPELAFYVQRFDPTEQPQESIRFACITRYEYQSDYNNFGVGHHVANLSWYVHTGEGNSSYAYAHESKIDIENPSAVVSNIIGNESQISSNLGSVQKFVGHQARVTGSVGAIDSFVGFAIDIAQGVNSISEVIGLDFPDMSTTRPGDGKYALVNRDAEALVLSAAPIIDQSITYASPSSNGFTVTIPPKKSVVLIMPSGAFSNGTVNFPLKSSVVDGQMIEMTFTQSVTSVSWGANGAAFVLNPPNGVNSGQTVRFRYFSVVDWWIRV